MYTIGIKRKFGIGFRKYRVKGHTTEFSLRVTGENGDPVIRDIKPRLVLRLEDDSRVLIPKIEDKEWRIYSDFFKKDDAPWQDTVQKNSTVPQVAT